ncbi:MAG: exodeoxyribonuclease VII large subunit [Clostridia bacterium]|nr:exodeoxyribonuclease VII large subunit [Clostridia bacterium]
MEQFEKLVVSVSQLNNYIKGLFDEIPVFRNVYVSGEISNFKHHLKSGHYYFSLKDENSVIKCVMFRTYASRLRFMPENGMQVLVKARLSVFERDGVYQLYAEDMQPQGMGGLHVAYEQLKEKLFAEGLFDESRKKPLPRYPETVGVITSPTGAAIRDITNILTRRYPLARMILEPVLVQGEGAPAQLCAALRKFNEADACDVIIIGRGGGSIEDLWAFNSEALAREIAASHIPVISAVGHETDYTIADFAADMRAPTPSAAAELAVPNLSDVYAALEAKKTQLLAAITACVHKERLRLECCKTKPCLTNVRFVIDESRMKTAALTQRLEARYEALLLAERNTLRANIDKLEALSPLKVLSRGYSVVKKDGKTIYQAAQLAGGDTLEIRLAQGSVRATVEETRS